MTSWKLSPSATTRASDGNWLSMLPSNNERDTTIPPILRVIFPDFNDKELLFARDRLADFFRSVYLRYRDEIEDAIAHHPLDN